MTRAEQDSPIEIFRAQSVDGGARDSSWSAVRRLIHLPNIRAIVAALSLITIVGSIGALTVAVRHDVSAGAVFRYFSRTHSEIADLGPLLSSGATAMRLEPYVLLPPGVDLGGLVYAEEDGLVFYPHTTRHQAGLVEVRIEKQELYSRLTPLYWRADLDGLARELNKPSVRQRLLAEGAKLQDLYTFQRYNNVPVDAAARTRLLRTAARQIQLVAPYIPEPFQLGFAEELRFYEAHKPKGKFVGLWELSMPSPFGTIDAGYAHEMSTSNHYIVISKYLGETMVSDFYEGIRRNYLVKSIGHPSGRTFYRLTAQPAS